MFKKKRNGTKNSIKFIIVWIKRKKLAMQSNFKEAYQNKNHKRLKFFIILPYINYSFLEKKSG